MKYLALALGALALASIPCVSAHADTISGSAKFTDISNSNNGVTFAGTFAHPTFSFTGNSYTDLLTIDPSSSFFSSGTDNLQVALTFTLPNPVSGDLNGTGNVSFSGFLTENNTIDWNNDGIATIDFADGTVLQASLADFKFNGSGSDSENLTLTVEKVGVPTSPVPEPSTLALFGTGIFGLAGMARRKFLPQS